MRNYIILNGKNSNTITGLLISTLPPITKPQIRTQTEEIDGLDGDIVTKLGYSAYEKEFEIGLYGEFDINEVIAYFNTEGTVVFSNEDDKYYNYQIISQIDYDKLIRFKKASIKMHVQPFKYPLTETPVEIEIQNVNNEAEAVDLDNTAEAPMTLAPKGNTSQSGTPTPTSPIPVSVVSGDNDVVVSGKNILENTITTQTLSGINYTKNQDGSITMVGTSTSANSVYGIFTTPLILRKDKTYVFSIGNKTSNFGIYLQYGANSNVYYIGVSSTATSTSFTPQQDTMIDRLAIHVPSGNTLNITIFPMIEVGNSATSYELYQSQTYPINLPVENLYEGSQDFSGVWNNANQWLDADETYNGLAVKKRFNAWNGLSKDINVEAGQTYTFSLYVKSDTSRSSAIYIAGGTATITPSSLSITTTTEWKRYSLTFTASVGGTVKPRLENTTDSSTNATYICGYQLAVGNRMNEYQPYGTTPIELCKIGTYQDYFTKNSDGQWCKYNAIKKLVLDGSEAGWNNDFGANLYSNGTIAAANPFITGYGLSNYYKYNPVQSGISANTVHGEFALQYGGAYNMFFKNTSISTTDDFKTWLSTHNTTVYFPNKTPYLSLIEDEGLIGQLNALEQARSYDTKTHINQNSNDKPFIINATAVQKGSDTGIVDNEGNIYSKPTIDIEGSGTADIYLNNNQIFSVDLSSSNECIIDTAKLEAYNPSTNALMNRQVTGDYSSFILNTGENTIRISGNVTKATISNYTRWL